MVDSSAQDAYNGIAWAIKEEESIALKKMSMGTGRRNGKGIKKGPPLNLAWAPQRLNPTLVRTHLY